MAPFNQRQIGYIQAIAGRQQHTTLIHKQDDEVISSVDSLSTFTKPQTFNTNLVVCGTASTAGASNSYDGSYANAKSLLLHTWHLDERELGFDSRNVHNNDQLDYQDFQNLKNIGAGFGQDTRLNAFDAPVKGYTDITTTGNPVTAVSTTTGGNATGTLMRNPDLVSSVERATPDGKLVSTDLKFRFTLPAAYTDRGIDSAGSEGIHTTHPMGQDHYEFRWIVWRSKRPTLHLSADDDGVHTNLEMIRNGCSFRHPGYDLFKGYTGRKRGFLGFTYHKSLDKEKMIDDVDTEKYSGWYPNSSGVLVNDSNFSTTLPSGEGAFTVDDLMTMNLNKDDYVIMKDVRFFLGKEHGKSHFEDRLHWDWNDPIDTQEDNVLTSTTLNNKNYRWHCTLLGTSGGKSVTAMNVSYRLTTKMESG